MAAALPEEETERLECSSLASVLSAPYRNVRFFPSGDDALAIVHAEVQRQLERIAAAPELERHKAQRDALHFITNALKWLEDACISQLLNDCSEGEVSRVCEDWCCTETDLERELE